jgi:Cation efflux family
MACRGSKKVILAALTGNLIAIAKLVAAWITGSSAMLSEAVHSVVDTGNQGLMLHGMRQAAKPPTAEHPFEHGPRLLDVHRGDLKVASCFFATSYAARQLKFQLTARLVLVRFRDKTYSRHAGTGALTRIDIRGRGGLWGLMHKHANHNRCHATFDDFKACARGGAQKWGIYCDQATDNWDDYQLMTARLASVLEQ